MQVNKLISTILTWLSFIAISACESEPIEKIVYIEKEVEVIKEVEVLVNDGGQGTSGGVDTTGGDTTGGDSTTGGSTSGGETLSTGSLNLMMTGSLALTDASSSGSSLRLTTSFGLAAGYSLFCTTFEEPPQACAISIDSEGDFETECVGFAGKSIGCFLRQNDTTLTTVEFGNSSSLVAGAGELISNITYDSTTKSAAAKVDEENSTALNPAAIKAAKTAQNVIDTTMADMSGTWNLTCVDDSTRGTVCANASSAIPSSLYLSQFEVESKTKIAVWENQTARNKCINGNYTDAIPNFKLNFGTSNANTSYALDFSSKAALGTSLENAFKSLETERPNITSALRRSAKGQMMWQVEVCEGAKFTSNLIDMNPTDMDPTATTPGCQFMLEEQDCWFDPWIGEEICYPRWIDSMTYADATSQYTGTITAGDAQVCTNDFNSDKPMCPKGVTINPTTGLGTITPYYGTDANGNQKKLLLACLVNRNGWIDVNFNPALSDNLADAITAAKIAAGCSKVNDADSPFDGEFKIVAEANVRGLLDLATGGNNYWFSPETMCYGYSLPSTFDAGNQGFNFCNQTMDYSQSTEMFYPCWENWSVNGLGVTLDTYDGSPSEGLYVLNDSNSSMDGSPADLADSHEFASEYASGYNWFDPSIMEIVCPSAFAAVDGSTTSIDINDYTAVNTNPFTSFIHACRNEFSSATSDITNSTIRSDLLAEQVAKFTNLSLRWAPPVQALTCSLSGSEQDEVQNISTNSCLPDVKMLDMCDFNGNCRSSMRCKGSSVKGGRCFDQDGMFAGQIPGRIGVMNLSLGVNGAFDLTNAVNESWVEWGQNGMEKCTKTYTTVIAATKDSDSEFSAMFRTNENENCEALESDDGTASVDGGATPAGTAATPAGGSYGSYEGMPALQEASGLGEILQKIEFSKQ